MYGIPKQSVELRTYQDLTSKAFFAGKDVQRQKLKKLSSAQLNSRRNPMGDKVPLELPGQNRSKITSYLKHLSEVNPDEDFSFAFSSEERMNLNIRSKRKLTSSVAEGNGEDRWF